MARGRRSDSFDDDGSDSRDEDPLPSDMDDDDSADVDATVCPSCGNDVYEDADRCPNCGEHIDRNRKRLPLWATILLLICLAMMLLTMF